MPQLAGKQVKDAPDGIDTAQINDSAVDTLQLATNAVTTIKITDGDVTTAKINNAAVDKDKINTDVVGDGLTGGAGTAIAVGAGDAINVDTNDIDVKVKAAGPIEIDTDELDIKDLGIQTGHIALLAVDTGQLAAGAVQPAKADLGAGQDWDFSGADSVSVPAPSTDAHATTKAYVDSVAQGLNVKESCVASTTIALPSYATGGSGVGKTLEGSIDGALPVIDGVTMVVGERILVKNENGAQGSEGAHVDHGIYTVDDLGSGSSKWLFTRATDFDEGGTAPAEVSGGAFTFIQEGTANADSGWVLTTDGTITIDTTALTFAQFSGAGSVTGGDGIDVTGTVVSADLKASGGLAIDTAKIKVAPGDFAGDGLEASGDNMQLDLKANDGLVIDTGELTTKVSDVAGTGLEDDGSNNLRLTTQGNGIAGGAGSTLSVLPNPTEPSIAVDASGVRAAVPYTGDRYQAPDNCTTDDDPTGIALTVTPSNPSNIRVLVNGIDVDVGDNTDTKECYFATAIAPTTAIAISAVVATDILVWNAGIAKYSLSATKDLVALQYSYVA